MSNRRNRRIANRVVNSDDEYSAEEDHDAVGAMDAEAERDEEPVSGESLEDQVSEDERELQQDNYYEQGSQDVESHADMDAQDRMRVDQELNERDRAARAQGRRPLNRLLEDLDSDDYDLQDRIRQRFLQVNKEEDRDLSGGADDEEEDDQNEIVHFLDIANHKGSLSKWITEQRTERFIVKKFRQFLFKYQKNQQLVYVKKITDMVLKNQMSLEIDYFDLMELKNMRPISLWIVQEPKHIFPILNATAMSVAEKMYPYFPQLVPEVFVKITNFPAQDSIRGLRQRDVGSMIRIEGVVTRRSMVFSQLKRVMYRCEKCGEGKGPIYINEGEEVKLGSCAVCQSKGPFAIDKQATVYRNYQKITVQESPGKVPPGRVPRQKEVVLLGDNIDSCRPGDEVKVTGVFTQLYDYRLNVKHGFPLFYTVVEANNIKRMSEVENIAFLKEDEQAFRKWAAKQHIGDIITNSIAPSIHGHRDIKTAIALALFGGVAKDVENKHRVRGDINVLILGDPGTAKSQFLKYVEKTFYRAVFTTGKGASAVGLTASVRRDGRSGEWCLEGGALVIADRGVCLIDEFDKMNEYDRAAIHEAMEQQSISISKAGIVATLQARCTVIAAANPKNGRYNAQQSFMDNVELSDPILSRFDVLCVVKDEVRTDLDSMLAAFVINSHIKNHPFFIASENPEDDAFIPRGADEEEIERRLTEKMPQDLLRKYILYAREKVHPRMTDVDKERIVRFYTQIREESTMTGGLAIATRHLESIIRMAEAHARMHLRNEVTNLDVDVAINVMLKSFIKSQKSVIANQMERKFRQYLSRTDDAQSVLMHILDRMMRDKQQILQTNLGHDQEVKIVKSTFENDVFAYGYDNRHIASFYNSAKFKHYYQVRGDVIAWVQQI